MKLKDFIGKVVIGKESKIRYIITKLDGVAIYAKTENLNSEGFSENYLWKTGTAPYDNAIANGTLIFEDQTLTKPFKVVYENYRYNEGKSDQHLYYCAKYD